mgnify:CR=1 FL=1
MRNYTDLFQKRKVSSRKRKKPCVNFMLLLKNATSARFSTCFDTFRTVMLDKSHRASEKSKNDSLSKFPIRHYFTRISLSRPTSPFWQSCRNALRQVKSIGMGAVDMYRVMHGKPHPVKKYADLSCNLSSPSDKNQKNGRGISKVSNRKAAKLAASRFRKYIAT